MAGRVRGGMTMAITMNPAGMAVLATGVTRSFQPGRGVLRGLDLSIVPGQFVALLGRSGAGKSTLLRILAGLDPDYGGDVLVPERRAVVFQEPRLIPWQKVRANVVLGLSPGQDGRTGLRQRSVGALGEVGLADHARAWPATLSGGEAQRVALARALVREPQLMLLDEPFGALDALTREQMNLEMLRIWRESGKTIIFVTHSIQEAVFLASHCAVLTVGPARMAEYFPIELPSPRTLPIKTTDEFNVYARRVYQSLGLASQS